MCRHIYNWNIVNCDVKQPIYLTVCRRWKCEVDHPSQSTEVNLGKKQKWCSLWCPWSEVQQDTSGPDNFRILGCLWTIHHRCTCKWDWTEMRTVSFPLIADCMKSASYEYRKMSARQREQFVPIGMPTVCWKTFPAKTTKILSTRNSSILMMSSSEYLFSESECSFTKYVSSCPKTKYLYLRLPFLKMNAFRIILVSLSFNFWWGMVV